jgi:hypothetical protein
VTGASLFGVCDAVKCKQIKHCCYKPPSLGSRPLGTTGPDTASDQHRQVASVQKH